MKHFMLFEDFSKKEDLSLEDFKNIKAGSSVLYKGAKYEVVESTGTILKLKSEKGQISTVNYNMFKGKGFPTKSEEKK